MTIAAVDEDGVRTRYAVVASLALFPVLAGGSRRADVLGASTHTVWLGVDDTVVVVGSSDAVRLPNGVTLPIHSSEGPFRSVVAGSAEVVGDGKVKLAGLEASIDRWWDPRPILATATAGEVMGAVTVAADALELPDDAGMGAALVKRAPGEFVRAALALLGAGEGLTPAGDDLIAGVVSAHILIGAALGDRGCEMVVTAATPALSRAAGARTTSLSAALLRHALRGEVVEPAARFLHAIVGCGSVVEAREELRAVGHSSGRALTAGMLIGAAAAAGREIP